MPRYICTILVEVVRVLAFHHFFRSPISQYAISIGTDSPCSLYLDASRRSSPARRQGRAQFGWPLGGRCGIPSRIVTVCYIKSNADVAATSALPGAQGRHINQSEIDTCTLWSTCVPDQPSDQALDTTYLGGRQQDTVSPA
eukprot:1186341-Prorocentrum_minimum.AAC.1